MYRDLTSLVNTYVDFQSKALRYEEKILVPQKSFKPSPIFYDVQPPTPEAENLTAQYIWVV